MANTKSRCNVGKDDILAAAFDLMAEAGEDGFSVRKVAGTVGVDPMTVLHHFGSKDGLLRHLADRSLAQISLARPSGDWAGDLRAVAASFRELAHRYPKLYHLQFRYHATGPVDHAASEIVYSAMLKAGLEPARAAEIGLAFFSFVIGFAAAETGGLMRPITDNDVHEIEAMDGGQFPATKALAPAFRTLNADRAFDEAISAFIAGLEVRLNAVDVKLASAASVTKVARRVRA
jgi:AcrR family transcriptional regulator